MGKDLYKAQRTIVQEMWGESRLLHSAVETVEWLVKRDIKELPCSSSQSVLMSVGVYRIVTYTMKAQRQTMTLMPVFLFSEKKSPT